MKKIILAADSFKGSLTSRQVAGAMERGIRAVFPACAVHAVTVADGGEGTVEALVDSLGGEFVTIGVRDPLMRPVEARYGIVDGGRTAVIEMAAASGLPLVEPELRNPLNTTTFGTGELIADALARGCRQFRIGIGGSATNDAGTGMLQALGYKFFDADGRELGQGGRILEKIRRIDDSDRSAALAGTAFTIACDVTNPFSGPQGAAYVFGPQKGADPAMVADLDRGLHHFAGVIERQYGQDIDLYPGAGAAGGLGGAFKAILGAELVSGIRMVLDAIGFDALLHGADLVLTGEGKLDAQTAMGKAPRGVLDAAERRGVPVVALGGTVEAVAELNRQGFAAVFPILPGPATLEKAMQPDFAAANIERTIEQIMRMAKR